VHVVLREGDSLLISNRPVEEWLLGWPVVSDRDWITRVVAALEEEIVERRSR
jgi:hypothetical protein